MLQAHRTMIRGGGRLTLRQPTSRVRRILGLARLDQVFDVEEAQRPEAVGT
jgi:anti-anti-sigma regulatory factor